VEALVDNDIDLELATWHGHPHLSTSFIHADPKTLRCIEEAVQKGKQCKWAYLMYKFSVKGDYGMSVQDIPRVMMADFDQIIEADESSKIPLMIKYMGFLLRQFVARAQCYDPQHVDLLKQLVRVNDKLSSKNMTFFKKHYHRLLVLDRQKDMIHGIGRITMLHFVCGFPDCQSQAIDMAQFLINIGADVNAQDRDGNTPLHKAAAARPFNAQLVDFLVNNNAHIDMVNSCNETPMDLQPTDPTAVSCLRQPVRHMSLQCLAARAVCRYNVQYKYNDLTEPCIAAIKQHSPPKFELLVVCIYPHSD
jgi:hypothetical protein